MSDGAVAFGSPPLIPFPGGCSLERAPYALDWLLSWRADLTVHGVPQGKVCIYEWVKGALENPPAAGLTPQQATEARNLFLARTAPALEAEGGQRLWLERELARP
ncbi:hypothetical protein ACFP81_03210 [Deinococcus lacus]|uniref:Uncharacterized protein n=1 Tax=Deinococcus lacus TaxID=392561 RepID=A0ABW1YAE8_9DEIO